MFKQLLSSTTLLIAAVAAPLASAQVAPEALVRQISTEVIEAAKTDKAIQAGDINKVIALVDTKVMPSVNFEVATRSAVGVKWREASPE